METTLSIRPATIDDLDAIEAIETQCHPIPWKRSQFEGEFKNAQSTFLVYTDDESDSIVAGYLIYWDTGEDVHILNVTVALEWRGLGMGQKLVRYAVNHAYRERRERVILEVRTANKPAIELYKKLGFEIDHTRNNFYSDGTDAYVMILRVNLKNEPTETGGDPSPVIH